MNNICKCGHEEKEHFDRNYLNGVCHAHNCGCSVFQSSAKEEKKFCANPNCDGDLEMTVGGHFHEAPSPSIEEIVREAYGRGYQEASEKAGHHFINEVLPEEVAIEFARKEGYERGKKDGNEENARVKNSGKILYQTGYKDGLAEGKKEGIAQHDATWHPLTKHIEMVKSDKEAREEWEKEGYHAALQEAVKVVEHINPFEESGAGKHFLRHEKPAEIIKEEVLAALRALEKE